MTVVERQVQLPKTRSNGLGVHVKDDASFAGCAAIHGPGKGNTKSKVQPQAARTPRGFKTPSALLHPLLKLP